MTRFIPLLAAASFAVGCSNEPEQVRVVLQRAQSCEDLEQMLKDDAMAKMNRRIDAQIYWLEHWEDARFGGGLAAEEDGATSGSGGASGGEQSGAGGEAPAPEHSETNTQVEGVDEADIVKTDGNYLYLLHGSELVVVSAWPATEMSMSSSTAIEGQPIEMFLAGEQLVVYSYVEGQGIFQEAGVEPPETDGYYGYYPGLTKVTVLGLDGAAPNLQDEFYFEGWYASARRVGSKVRTVLRDGYHPPMVRYWFEDYGNDYPDSNGEWIAFYERLRAENAQAIARASLNDFLPSRFVRDAGQLRKLAPSCTDYYVPTAGTTEYGMTQIHSFDLSAPELGLRETQIVGRTDTVYANMDAMYLAGQSWRDPFWEMPDWDEPRSTMQTHLHRFDISTDPLAPIYLGSGSVPGRVVNQFALDEKDGKLRIATTDTLVAEDVWESVNNLYVLENQGGHLAIIGSVTGLAPGESVQSARFVGDRGYVVTFRQVDPLFVFDLANPHDPKLLGALKIPGFSEYMHPLEGGTHLLTIGRDGTNSGQVTDPALQIFDVSDPTKPLLTHKHVLSSGWSEAESNHKAFTFFKGMLAIPKVNYGSSYELGSTTLELFDIDVNAGITPRGAIDHTAFFEGMDENYCYWYGYGVRRGVFIEDYVYSISEGGVLVSSVNDPATPVASMALPHTPYTGCYGEGGGI